MTVIVPDTVAPEEGEVIDTVGEVVLLLFTMIETAALVALLFEASVATAVSVCLPFESVLVFRDNEYELEVFVCPAPMLEPSISN